MNLLGLIRRVENEGRVREKCPSTMLRVGQSPSFWAFLGFVNELRGPLDDRNRVGNRLICGDFQDRVGV